jgi:hypothetical protein
MSPPGPRVGSAGRSPPSGMAPGDRGSRPGGGRARRAGGHGVYGFGSIRAGCTQTVHNAGSRPARRDAATGRGRRDALLLPPPGSLALVLRGGINYPHARTSTKDPRMELQGGLLQVEGQGLGLGTSSAGPRTCACSRASGAAPGAAGQPTLGMRLGQLTAPVVAKSGWSIPSWPRGRRGHAPGSRGACAGSSRLSRPTTR